MTRRFIRIVEVVELARDVRDDTAGGVTDADLQDLALTVLQLHAGYERLRAELVRIADRGCHGPGEWMGFYSDEQPRYPTFIHHVFHTKVVPDR